MRAFVLLAIATLAACKSNAPRAKEGEGCTSRGPWCAKGLFCHDERCMTWDDVEAAKTAAAEAKRQRHEAEDQKKELRMLREAGAKLPAAEVRDAAPATPDAVPMPPGDAVRVVELSDRGFAIAACRDGERLIGGGCEGEQLIADRPEGHSAADTLGARWRCEVSWRDGEVKAFALCARAE
jgi:hypothetical protein